MSTVVFTMGHPYINVWVIRLPLFEAFHPILAFGGRIGQQFPSPYTCVDFTQCSLCNNNELSSCASFA
jgi:hypothetical protein